MTPAPAARRPELDRGQILVIFAGAILTLLIITALVIDLGFVVMIRRHEQNAADPGAVAAARYIPAGDRAAMWRAACFYANQNGFRPRRTDNSAACDPGGGTDGSTITVHWPPSAAAGAFAGKTGYVEVSIRRQHQSFLAGVVGLPSFTVATNAVAANDDGSAGSASLVALSPKPCGGGAAAQINGGGSGGGIYIRPASYLPPGTPGGYVQVNSICGSPGASGDDLCTGSQGGIVLNGGAELHAPGVYVQGACGITGGSGVFNVGELEEESPYVGDPLSLVRPPDPGDLPTRNCPGGGASGTPSNPRRCNFPNGNVTLQPGTYYGGWVITNGNQITLDPGIYIIAGGGISQTGGLLTSAAGRVLIYSTDTPTFRAQCIASNGSFSNTACQRDIDVRGSGSLSLQGLDRSTGCPPYGSTSCPYGGMLLWQDGTGSGAYNGNADIDVGGGQSLNISGTIYSAGGNVSILGNGVTSGCTPDGTGNTNCAAVQIISDTWNVGGSAILEMPYDPNAFYRLNLKGLVH